MKTLFVLTAVVFLACALVGCDTDTLGPLESSPEAELQVLEKGAGNWEVAQEALEAQYVQAFANKDVDAFMSCVWNDPDVLFVLDYGMVVRGWDNIYTGVQQMMDAHESLTLEVLEIERFRRGAYVFAIGTAKWTRVLKPEYGGGTTEFTERWSDVRVKVAGKWVVMVNHVTIL